MEELILSSSSALYQLLGHIPSQIQPVCSRVQTSVLQSAPMNINPKTTCWLTVPVMCLNGTGINVWKYQLLWNTSTYYGTEQGGAGLRESLHAARRGGTEGCGAASSGERPAVLPQALSAELRPVTDSRSVSAETEPWGWLGGISGSEGLCLSVLSWIHSDGFPMILPTMSPRAAHIPRRQSGEVERNACKGPGRLQGCACQSWEGGSPGEVKGHIQRHTSSLWCRRTLTSIKSCISFQASFPQVWHMVITGFALVFIKSGASSSMLCFYLSS